MTKVVTEAVTTMGTTIDRVERNMKGHLNGSMPDEHTDWYLVEQVKSGNDDAFVTLMARFKRPVLSFVFRMIGDATEAEDLAQDVFVRAYRQMLRPDFRRTTAKFSTWLFQVARNRSLDCLRRRRRHPAEPLTGLEAGGKTISSPGVTAADGVMARETGDAIAAAVALLPEDQRTAIILAEYEELSYAQIADIMECSLKSVEARLYRARQFLRKRLAHLL